MIRVLSRWFAASTSMTRSGKLTRLAIHVLDRAARLLPAKDTTPAHLRTGRRGEEEAYFYLRHMGYVMIARNYRSPRCRSELDLVGWDGQMLCFIEVKTRTTRDIQPAEVAVDPEKTTRKLVMTVKKRARIQRVPAT